tara:strand:- start:2614 stop:3633 length:1020 start_codon:yes stop_codon:yes gene_type:complete
MVVYYYHSFVQIIVTGCFGFIGFNFINYLFSNYSNDFKVLGVDNLNNNCSSINKKLFNNKNFKHVNLDINDIDQLESKNIDIIINFAAQSHVDNSIFNPKEFAHTNVQGVISLLNYTKSNKIKKFIHMSTDEVFGSSSVNKFKENDKFNPASPYSASKASAEHFCKAFRKTYDQNILILRPCNNYGIFQQPEKLIPFSILNTIKGGNIEIYGEGKNVRNWIHVNDTSDAIIKLISESPENEEFNISTDYFLDNLSLAEKIINFSNLPKEKITFVKDRPGHDFRYATDNTKIKKMGWKPKYDFDESLVEIIDWYKSNTKWWSAEYEKTLKNRKKRFTLDT